MRIVLASLVLAGCHASTSLPSTSPDAVAVDAQPPVPDAAPAAPPGLHIAGRWVLDGNDQHVALRGVNIAGFIDYPGGEWQASDGTMLWGTWDADAVKANLAAIKSWGGNCIRLLDTVEWWMTDPDHRQHIHDFLSYAHDAGIYVAFGFWRVAGSSTEVAFPYPPENGGADDTALIADQAAFAALWADVATQLKQHDNVLFDLWNEPHGSDEDGWFAAVQQSIDAIRATGATNVIAVEWDYQIIPDLQYNAGAVPGRWSLSWIEDHPLTGTNILYSTHTYWDRNNTNTNTYAGLLDGYASSTYLDHVLEVAQKPVWIGEIGANIWYTGQDLTDELTWFANALAVFQHYELGFTSWVWRGEGQPYYLIDYARGYPPSAAGEVLRGALQ